MRNKTMKLLIAAACLTGFTGQAMAKPARIGMTKAREIALRLAPGKIKQAEYEKENGGWRYSFDIQQGNRIHEIGVDAFTGKVVEDSFEKPGSPD